MMFALLPVGHSTCTTLFDDNIVMIALTIHLIRKDFPEPAVLDTIIIHESNLKILPTFVMMTVVLNLIGTNVLSSISLIWDLHGLMT
jgi:hypothetical protein